jgi:hypothetical protein
VIIVVRREMRGLIIDLNSMNLENEISLLFKVKLLLG